MRCECCGVEHEPAWPVGLNYREGDGDIINKWHVCNSCARVSTANFCDMYRRHTDLLYEMGAETFRDYTYEIWRIAEKMAYVAHDMARATGDVWEAWPEDTWYTIDNFDLNLWKEDGFIKADLYHRKDHCNLRTVFYRIVPLRDGGEK